VKCSLSLTLEFSSPEEAKKLLDSVRLDNGEYIAAHLDGKKIICLAGDESLGGLLHTVEDFLSCVSLAEKMVKKSK